MFSKPLRTAFNAVCVRLMLSGAMGNSCVESLESSCIAAALVNDRVTRHRSCVRPSIPQPLKSVAGSEPWNPSSSQCFPYLGIARSVPIKRVYSVWSTAR